jgi:hypothetical protein
MEMRKQYFGSRMVKSGGAAAAISLSAVIMVFSVAILVPEPSLGGERGEQRRPSPELMVDRLSSHLQLSTEQQAAIKPVIAEELQRRRTLLEQYRAEEQKRRREVRLEMTEIDEDTTEQMAAFLSPEQLEKFSLLQEKRRISVASRQTGWSGRHDRGGRGPWPEDRTDDQPALND